MSSAPQKPRKRYLVGFFRVFIAVSSGAGSAQVGYFDRAGAGENPDSWNSARPGVTQGRAI
jgi:hypothetical protein